MTGAETYAMFYDVLGDFVPVFVVLLSIFVAIHLLSFIVRLVGDGSRG